MKINSFISFIVLISTCLWLPPLFADGSYFYSRPRGEACTTQHCKPCQCTDLGRYRNDCISDSRYCEAFGNIGAR